MKSTIENFPNYLVIFDDKENNKIIFRERFNKTHILLIEKDEPIPNCSICLNQITNNENCFFFLNSKKFNCLRLRCNKKVSGMKELLEEIPPYVRDTKNISIGEGYLPLTYFQVSNGNHFLAKIEIEKQTD